MNCVGITTVLNEYQNKIKQGRDFIHYHFQTNWPIYPLHADYVPYSNRYFIPNCPCQRNVISGRFSFYLSLSLSVSSYKFPFIFYYCGMVLCVSFFFLSSLCLRLSNTTTLTHNEIEKINNQENITDSTITITFSVEWSTPTTVTICNWPFFIYYI